MAAIPGDYLTAIYAFMHLSQLAKVNMVLIDCGSGYFNVAALCVARCLGAEAYVIAASPEHVETLTKRFDIEASRMFLPSEGSIDERVMQATRNMGST